MKFIYSIGFSTGKTFLPMKELVLVFLPRIQGNKILTLLDVGICALGAKITMILCQATPISFDMYKDVILTLP